MLHQQIGSFCQCKYTGLYTLKVLNYQYIQQLPEIPCVPQYAYFFVQWLNDDKIFHSPARRNINKYD